MPDTLPIIQTQIFDDRICELGEGPFWHPERKQLFWFDILGQRLLTREGGQPREWQFKEMCSAAGWIDHDTLLIATEHRLMRFDLKSGEKTTICPLEADRPDTRSNDGRADPQGGFWIGTMSKSHSPNAGSIWRYYQGELRCLFSDISVSNSICFTPCGTMARFSDTPTRRIMQVGLDAEGWPTGEPRVFLDLGPMALNPDGAVIDTAGTMWVAQWGAGRIAGYDISGQHCASIPVEAPHSSCPAFGGEQLDQIFITTALENLSHEQRQLFPKSGAVFTASTAYRGQSEHRVCEPT